MGRIYAVPISGTVTNAGGNTDLISLQAADDKPIRLRGFVVGQSSELGDGAEEGLRLTVLHLPTTFTVGTGGSAVTASKPINDPVNGADWGFTARTNDTTVATSNGTTRTQFNTAWNLRNSPFDFWFPDVDFCPHASQGAGLVLRLESTPADDLTFEGTAYVEELG